MLNRAKPLSNNNSWADDRQWKSPKMKHSDQKGALRKPLWEEQSLQNAKKNNKTTKKKSSDRRRPSKHSENKWHLCKVGSFTYGESPLTPPLEGTSLHQWNNSVEWPWGILSLFTTCLCMCVKSPCHRLWHVDYPRKAHWEERNTRKY